jgi:UDP-N-acetylmuramoylalanine--D-glutamate ligase
MIIISPGIPLDLNPLRAARERGVPVIGEMELAIGLFDTPVVAVTGTNGKSTVVSILQSMISKSGANLFVGGNIGTPLMEYVAGDQDADYVLVEVSSFQLDTMEQFCPFVSLLLNISPDHLDRYADYDAYVKSKLKIFQNQGPGNYALLNDDDERLSGFQPGGGVSVLRYGIEEKDGRNAFLDGRRLIARLPEKEEFSFDIDKFPLPGRHNIENLMGSVLVGLALGIEHDVIEKSIVSFKGLPHRIELVGTVRGIDFYDDSKATNVDAALKSICSFEKPLILIAGGRDKGGDYAPLVRSAQGRVKKVILLGEARQMMARSFEGVIPFSLADSMKDAVLHAFYEAKSNDVVLLAPACSSFDMFSDYAHRGRVFREEIKEISNGG